MQNPFAVGLRLAGTRNGKYRTINFKAHLLFDFMIAR
jgi:hypothetical protein